MAYLSKVKLNDTLYNLKDAEVPSWAKAANKPAYTASEVGALPDTYTAPVTSVNEHTGAVIVSEYDDTALTDNNVQQILIKEEGVDKYNNPAISYSYNLTNINTAHTLIITCISTTSTEIFYIKQNGSWVTVNKIYKKINDSWIEQKLSYLSENNLKYLKQGS